MTRWLTSPVSGTSLPARPTAGKLAPSHDPLTLNARRVSLVPKWALRNRERLFAVSPKRGVGTVRSARLLVRPLLSSPPEHRLNVSSVGSSRHIDPPRGCGHCRPGPTRRERRTVRPGRASAAGSVCTRHGHHERSSLAQYRP